MVRKKGSTGRQSRFTFCETRLFLPQYVVFCTHFFLNKSQAVTKQASSSLTMLASVCESFVRLAYQRGGHAQEEEMNNMPNLFFGWWF